MQINNFLENSANRYPDKPAVWYKGQWKTYGEINRLSNKVANFLLESGIRRGDRVALLLKNSFNYIINYYAILKCGGVTVALNTESNSDNLNYILRDCGAKTLITQSEFTKQTGQIAAKGEDSFRVIVDQSSVTVLKNLKNCAVSTLDDIYRTGKAEPVSIRCIDMDLASIVYTSGSTGKAKGVMLTHLNIAANTHSIVRYLQLTTDDRIMVVLPFYYIYGKSLLNTHFYTGGSVVIDNRFAFPNVILQTMAETGVTGLAGVPSTYIFLLNKSTLAKKTFKNLRYVTQAGGAMSPLMQKRVADIFAPAKLYVMYGATEASARLSFLDPDDLPRKWGSIGKAIPNVEMFVVDEQGRKLPAGQVGEIVARGSNIMAGYWQDPQETDTVLKDGLYFTGDLGKQDDEGFFYVTGRSRDMIKAGGERVSAREVEDVISELKEVLEVAVIGIEDDYSGEAIKAFVVRENSAAINHESILAHCRRRLPGFKVPRVVEIIKSLPKNEAGKIRKGGTKGNG